MVWVQRPLRVPQRSQVNRSRLFHPAPIPLDVLPLWSSCAHLSSRLAPFGHLVLTCLPGLLPLAYPHVILNPPGLCAPLQSPLVIPYLSGSCASLPFLLTHPCLPGCCAPLPCLKHLLLPDLPGPLNSEEWGDGRAPQPPPTRQCLHALQQTLRASCWGQLSAMASSTLLRCLCTS